MEYAISCSIYPTTQQQRPSSILLCSLCYSCFGPGQVLFMGYLLWKLNSLSGSPNSNAKSRGNEMITMATTHRKSMVPKEAFNKVRYAHTIIECLGHMSKLRSDQTV
jgi:hypothetical protein